MILENHRKINVFEVILLIVGIAIAFVGFYAIYFQYKIDGRFTWDTLMALFAWMMLLLIFIMVAIVENVKEELSTVIGELSDEVRLLRDISHKHVDATNHLRTQLLRKR